MPMLKVTPPAPSMAPRVAPPPAISAAAGSFLVGGAGAAQVVYADVEGHDLGPLDGPSHRLIPPQSVEQFGARLPVHAEVIDPDPGTRVIPEVRGVTVHVAPLRAHPRGQGVAEGHVIPGDGLLARRCPSWFLVLLRASRLRLGEIGR